MIRWWKRRRMAKLRRLAAVRIARRERGREAFKCSVCRRYLPESRYWFGSVCGGCESSRNPRAMRDLYPRDNATDLRISVASGVLDAQGKGVK